MLCPIATFDIGASEPFTQTPVSAVKQVLPLGGGIVVNDQTAPVTILPSASTPFQCKSSPFDAFRIITVLLYGDICCHVGCIESTTAFDSCRSKRHEDGVCAAVSNVMLLLT
jgi:hypothetical protein